MMIRIMLIGWQSVLIYCINKPVLLELLLELLELLVLTQKSPEKNYGEYDCDHKC